MVGWDSGCRVAGWTGCRQRGTDRWQVRLWMSWLERGTAVEGASQSANLDRGTATSNDLRFLRIIHPRPERLARSRLALGQPLDIGRTLLPRRSRTDHPFLPQGPPNRILRIRWQPQPLRDQRQGRPAIVAPLLAHEVDHGGARGRRDGGFAARLLFLRREAVTACVLDLPLRDVELGGDFCVREAGVVEGLGLEALVAAEFFVSVRRARGIHLWALYMYE